MYDCFCGAVVEAVEVLFKRFRPESQSFKQRTWYYSVIAHSMKAEGLINAYISTAQFAV